MRDLEIGIDMTHEVIHVLLAMTIDTEAITMTIIMVVTVDTEMIEHQGPHIMEVGLPLIQHLGIHHLDQLIHQKGLLDGVVPEALVLVHQIQGIEAEVEVVVEVST